MREGAKVWCRQSFFVFYQDISIMKKPVVLIALLSATILSTELFWTRLFSAEFYYTFAFLVLSLAILGLGLGALFHSLVHWSRGSHLLPLWFTMTGVSILAAVPVVFSLHLDFSLLVSQPVQILKLSSAILVLGAGFFFGGIALAQLLRATPDDLPRLYMADFLGASVGVVAFVVIMNAFGAAVTLFWCTIPVLLAAMLVARRWMKIMPAAAMIVAVLYYVKVGGVPEQQRQERAPIVYKHWDATAKIKVYEFDSTSRGINIDNVANTPVYKFDGRWNAPDSEKIRFAIDVRNLMQRFDKCRFLSLGAGGGSEVLQALQYGATEVHAVEVIPHINEMMKNGYLRDYSGNIYNDPRVHVITDDARAYARKFTNTFDLIYSLSSNSWAAIASGSFALAENYLFTTEAIGEYWNALSDSGYISIEHQFYMPRLVAETLDALRSLGVPQPERHLAVYDLPTLRRKLLLISRRPLDGTTVSTAYANSSPEIAASMRCLWPSDTSTNMYATIVRAGWQSVADTARIDIRPCTDNRPFIAQLGLLRNLHPAQLEKIPLYEFTGFPLSRVIMIIILAVCTVIVVPLNLLPFLRKGERLAVQSWGYFFCIGIGYMIVEVILIQQYTLFIGSSITSIALVLMVLLVASGVGSLHSRRYDAHTIFGGIALWLVADVLLFRHFSYFLGGWDFVPRIALSALVIAPVGYLMGMPFPLAAVRKPELVDWAFAVTGSASVIGSVLAVLVASGFGYAAALGVGLFAYGTAYFLKGEHPVSRPAV
jgi:hypothetical protein